MLQRLFRTQSPPRLIASGFALVILTGSVLLMLPCCVQKGVSLRYIDSLYTATSAVCVTGLSTVDAGTTFTPLGQFILALLIQIGGLGVAAMGTGIMIIMGKKVNIKSRVLVREAMNLDGGDGVIRFIRIVFQITIVIELAGAVLSFPVFIRDYSLPRAIGTSLFHSVAAFNNSGFDIIGNFQNLAPYYHNVLLNLVTCALIVLGGLGFLVIHELYTRRNWKKLSMHAKCVICTTIALIIIGTVLLKLTENISWMAAFFHSISSRTAGFSTCSLGNFTSAGLMVITILMVIGASPGSTGGGIKTTTFLTLIQGIKSAATNKSEKAFHYAFPKDAFRKASVITLLASGVIFFATWLLLILEPQLPLMDALFEMTSAFSTTGLSTGITPTLGLGAKVLSMLLMYSGRLGPLTVASLWYFSHGERVHFPVGNITIG